MSAAIMKFPNNRLASFTCSFGAADRSSYEVIGTKGVAKMDPTYEMVGDLKCELTVGGKKEKTTYKERDPVRSRTRLLFKLHLGWHRTGTRGHRGPNGRAHHQSPHRVRKEWAPCADFTH
jgi:hypothetical protein